MRGINVHGHGPKAHGTGSSILCSRSPCKQSEIVCIVLFLLDRVESAGLLRATDIKIKQRLEMLDQEAL